MDGEGRAVQGCMWAVLLGLPLWCGLLAAAWWLVRH